MTERGETLRNGGKQERAIITGEGCPALKRTVLKVTEETRTVADRESRETEGENAARERRKEHIPKDEYLKTDRPPFRMTEKMMKTAAFMGQSQGSFERAAEMTGMMSGVKIRAEPARKATEYAGKKVFEQDRRNAEETDKNMAKTAYKPEKEGVLYITADGSMASTRTEGKKGSAWQENKPGIVFNGNDVKERPGGEDGEEVRRNIGKKEYVTHTGGADEFRKLLFESAVRNGYGLYKTTVVVSDGAVWIKNMSDELFPDAVQIPGFFHLKEHVYEYAKFLFNGDEGLYKEWAGRMSGLLTGGESDKVLEELEKYEGGKPPEGVSNLAGYIKNNRARIDYPRYKSPGYYIGSGPTGSGNKSVVRQRCKQAGMRWSVEGVQYVLSLRAKAGSGLWPSGMAAISLSAA